MIIETVTEQDIAEAMAAEIGRIIDYQDVETDGAAKVAALISELL